ncbi:MAG: class I SAM-dependent methyltransferase [Chloroflexi bacterium]|nr:class I SAM-dependent methyltransferase [Chloroflexota bacterium]MCC6893777.1 class I SAM-dependent methyltransferase [Anaerolineae bacterium]
MAAHYDHAAERGVPSLVWRAGQERRLQMIAKWTKLDNAAVLIAGCGVGTYATQIRRRYTPNVEAFDIEADRVREAQVETPHALVSAAESLPYADNLFDTILSHEVLEHVLDDRKSIQEMVRVLKPGGRVIIFVPNRWYPFETHGHYWRGQYHFGNTPLINYLPDVLRNRLAPHVRAYTAHGLRGLFDGCPVKLVAHQRIYGGYDNIIARLGNTGRVVRDTLYRFEGTPFDLFGLSHLLIMEKTQ